jgi:hypothetical protein
LLFHFFGFFSFLAIQLHLFVFIFPLFHVIDVCNLRVSFSL